MNFILFNQKTGQFRSGDKIKKPSKYAESRKTDDIF